ncbi:predicted protein [Uncinocarpus reesii 1704]|uniref:Uncharacterized protein n=1 Tax=Uncinocarpus reesii (strain UAMH 1704) TaxID=336963 RepID=C4JHF6_UNCRE|nr:uncharacterized protein UREG_01319 [Uncinocarpus reesii 1704]EEP76470.1 predicted protein [Uncinocarpus reesii 1704]
MDSTPRAPTEPPSSQLTAQLEQSQPQSADAPVAISLENPALLISNPITKPFLPSEGPATPRCTTPLQPPATSSKPDNLAPGTPATPKRTGQLAPGLSLHVPQRLVSSQSGSFSRPPNSPKLDSTHIYTSPSSVLPRRSRGLDFSRASTNLHHSTLAEASPDSSPIVGGRGVTIPQRRPGNGSGFASPNNSHSHIWSGSGHGDRISSSVSSINMLDSDSSSCSDEDDDASLAAVERGEFTITTPQAAKTFHSLSNVASPNVAQSPATDWMQTLSSTKPSLMSFQRARYRGKTRHSSTSTSGTSSRPSPGPRSPPVPKSVETFPSGYFSKEAIIADVKSRRESLSLGTSDLHLSDMSDDAETKQGINSSSSGSIAGGSNPEFSRRGVIRRAVTRRGNLLPKTKTFSRIKAALMEEGAPIESEAKKEAEVIRQVRESDSLLPPLSPSLITSALPLVSQTEDGATHTSAAGKAACTDFSQQASENSGGVQFWNSFDRRHQTPPPPFGKPFGDTAMQTSPGKPTSLPQPGSPFVHPRPLGPQAVLSQAATDLSQRLSKRRRVDDLDLDLASFKRRAVSPGTSTQSSPSQSQAFSFPENTHSNQLSKAVLCQNSAQSTSTGHSQPIKRVGLQGMTETNEGLMNMSID